MRGLRVRLAAAALALVALGGCAAQGVDGRAALSRRIVDDSIAYNEAYSGAITGQILLNILRAYNRQPRQYMSMSGFNNADPDNREIALGLGGLPLGELGSRWGEGALGMTNKTTLEPGYNVEPFGAEAFAQIAFRPTQPSVFRRYWESNWNHDVLLLVMVDQAEVTEAGAAPQILNNGPGTIDNDCIGDQYRVGGCAFVRAMREVAQDRTGAQLMPADERGRVVLSLGPRRYALRLRSLDAMVFYVGELLRRNEANPSPAAETGVLEARLGVIGPGSYLPEDRVPLFRVVEATRETERDYAATVSYAGKRYSAAAPANRFCFDPSSERGCNGGARGDRSGTLLELLAGVLAYNQSPEAVAAPQTSIINAR